MQNIMEKESRFRAFRRHSVSTLVQARGGWSSQRGFGWLAYSGHTCSPGLLFPHIELGWGSFLAALKRPGNPSHLLERTDNSLLYFPISSFTKITPVVLPDP